MDRDLSKEARTLFEILKPSSNIFSGISRGTGFRRNTFEKDGNEVPGGVVVMRYGENPLAVTERVKHKIQELQPGLPDGAMSRFDAVTVITGRSAPATALASTPMLKRRLKSRRGVLSSVIT